MIGIAKEEFHDIVIDLVKRNNLYMRPHWAMTTTKTPICIGYVKELVVALIDHGFEINLMSMSFYKKGK